MEIILTSKRSIGEQIKEKIVHYIQTGVYAPKEKLPSVRELAVELKVNPNTIAKVYAALETEGYIYSLAKKGYYVADVKPDEGRAEEEFKRVLVNALDSFGEEKVRAILDEAIKNKEKD